MHWVHCLFLWVICANLNRRTKGLRGLSAVPFIAPRGLAFLSCRKQA